MRSFALRRHEESSEVQYRRRSPSIPANNAIDNSTEISFVASSSVLAYQKQRSHPQLTDRTSTSHHHHHHHHQSKLVRSQSRTHSSSSDERAQVAAVSQLSSNDTTDDDDDPNNPFSHHSRLRRKYVKSRHPSPLPPPPSLSRQQSLREHTLSSPSPTLRCTSNGVSLRPKHQSQQQQQYPSGAFQSSSKDMGKKLKRFTFDAAENRWHHQYQIVPNNQPIVDSNIYRPSMGIVPSLNANVYGVQINNDPQSRSKVIL